jgi:uncharacterized membrane protein
MDAVRRCFALNSSLAIQKTERRIQVNILLIILRILHIVAGILWAGGAVHYFMFIEPTAKATVPESQKFMGYLMTRKRWSKFMSLMSLLTVLAGAALFYRIAGVDWDWIATGPGVGFTIGAIAGILVFLAGNLLIAPRINVLGKISQEIQANGGSPSTGQAAVLTRIQKETEVIGRVDFALILIALVTMSTARYWSF